MKTPVLVIGIVGALMLAGCSSVSERRIAKHAATWNQLAPAEQERLRQGAIEAGDSQEKVLIALGAPDRKTTRRGANGEVLEAWVYWHVVGQRSVVAERSAASLVQTTVSESGSSAAENRIYAAPSQSRTTEPYQGTEPIWGNQDRAVLFSDGVVVMDTRRDLMSAKLREMVGWASIEG